jgi:glycosyltransferase involved in cell wall biosynthesis
MLCHAFRSLIQADRKPAYGWMMSAPTISIVTPSFNQAAFVEETLTSVLNQNYNALEYIVIDGGSTDGSVDILERYRSRLHHFVSEPDYGHANALNKGFRQSSGEIMAWLNSDDKYLPWTLQTVAEIFDQHPDVNWITGTQAWWNDRGAMLETDNVYRDVWDFLSGNFRWIQQESVFWRRSLWVKAGGFINEDYRFMVDGELWTRFFLHDKLWHAKCVLSGYRMHRGNRARMFDDACEAEMLKATKEMRRRLSMSARVGLKPARYPLLTYRQDQSRWVKTFLRRGFALKPYIRRIVPDRMQRSLKRLLHQGRLV